MTLRTRPWPHGEAVEEAIASTDFSGVVAVDSGDVPVFRAQSGYAHRALEEPNTSETRFAIASGSKAFTALAVMRLAEQGEIDLDASIREWIGDDLPRIDGRVTIRQLLAHRSGVGDYLEESEGWRPDHYTIGVPVHTLTSAEAFLPAMSAVDQARGPGEAFSYCNAGFVILAIILERVTGKSFHDCVENFVFTPAGMKSSAYLRLDELPRDVATGYIFASGDRVNTLHLPVRGNGDSGAFSTTADLHRFWTALFSGRIVSAESVATMLEPVSTVPEMNMSYGLGFWLSSDGEAVILEGCDAGASFRSTHEPRSGTTVTVVSNTTEGAWPIIEASL